MFLTTRPSSAGAISAATAFLLPIAYLPFVGAAYWSPKAAVLLVCSSCGIPALLALVQSRAHRSAAIAALSFLSLAALSATLSPRPWISVLGLYNWGTGVLFLACCVGLWALGVVTPDDDRPLIIGALITGVAISALVALLQTFDLVEIGSLRTEGRAWGLAGNPVHLGSLCAAVVSLAAIGARRRFAWCVVASAGALIAQLSGTRFALVVVVVACLAGAVRADARHSAMLVAAVVAGLLAGSAIAASNDLSSASGRSVGAGTAFVSGGTTQARVEVWRSALTGFAERPVLGYGPGRFRSAASPHRSLREAQLEGGDVLYVDAHNIVLEELVNTGLIGTLVFLAWLGLAVRRARGQLLWGALAIAGMSLVQPQQVGVTPLMFLLLGVASSAPSPPPPSRRAVLPAAAVGLSAAVVLLTVDVALIQAVDHNDADLARRADALIPVWPEPMTLRARFAQAALDGSGSSSNASIDLRRAALERDPTNPAAFRALADALRERGDLDEAERLYRRGLELNPWSTSLLVRYATLSEERGDHAAARRAARRAISVEPQPEMEELLTRLAS